MLSEPLFALFEEMFSSTNGSCPPEYYYKTCEMMLRLQRNYPEDIFSEACELCLENRLFTGKRLENVLKTVQQSHQTLHMPGMASCWKTLTETHQLNKLSLSDGLELLLQSELDNRRNNRIGRLIKSAGFKQQATLEELETSDARGIPAGAITQLASGEYLKNGATIIISGPTGTGKSYLACALGERACRLGYKVKYYTVNRLLDELKLARLEGHELKFFERMEHLDLLIIDDFGMKRLEGSQQNDFEQIIDDRYHKKSLILSSQLAVADWYGIFSNEMLAEACLDRVVHKSLRFDLKGDSMRKKY